MKDYVSVLPTKEEVYDLRSFVKMNITKFSGDNQNFEKEFAMHTEMIRRYDEVLSEKASKHSVYEVEKLCGDNVKAKIEQAMKVVKQSQSQILENHKEFEEFKKMMSQ